MKLRNLFPLEQAFIERMLRTEAGNDRYIEILPKCLVREMDDGKMGGLVFAPEDQSRRLGKKIAEIEFFDADGVAVIATLNLDDHGNLYELELWKTDFSALQRLPVETS